MKKMKDPRVQAMFKRSGHNHSSISLTSQDYYELTDKTIGDNGKIYHIFKPNKYSDVQDLYQDKSSIDKTITEFKLVNSTSWIEKNQPLTFEMTRDKCTGRYRLVLKSQFLQ